VASRLRAPSILTAILGVVVLAQSSLGLLLPHQYRDAEWIKAGWTGNDWTTLVLAVPLLSIAPRLARRGSVAGLLVWLGVLGYAAYNGAFYLFGAALNVFFPLYVAAFLLAMTTLILILARVDGASVAGAFRPTTPVRMIGGYFSFVGSGLASVWIALWAGYVFAGRSTPIEPEAFKLVAALDLLFMTAALVSGGILLWRQDSWGYVIAPIAGIQSSLYLLVLSVNSIVAIGRGLVTAPGEFPMWGMLTLVTTAVTLRLLAGVSIVRLHSNAIRYCLGGLLAFGAVNAFGGGYYGLTGAKGVPTKWLEGSPFSDYFVPSLVLLVVVGGAFLVAAIVVIAGWPTARAAALTAGLVVLAWLLAQVAIIGLVSWMQPTTAIAAAGILVLGWQLPHKATARFDGGPAGGQG